MRALYLEWAAASDPTLSSVERCGLEERGRMVVDLILEMGVAGGVRARSALENDRLAARQNEPQKDAGVTESDLAADQARVL